MKKTHTYNDYEQYVNFQKLKTTDPKRQEKWKTTEWRLKIDIFKKEFERNINIINNCKNAICLGSRTGQEVVALQELGVNDTKGIDLVEFEPYTQKGDIHNVDFPDNHFDLAFTNIFDHSIYPEKFASEIERILKPNGYLIIHFQIDIHQDKFTEVIIDDFNEVKNLFKNFDIISEQNIDTGIIAMNYELIIKKK